MSQIFIKTPSICCYGLASLCYERMLVLREQRCSIVHGPIVPGFKRPVPTGMKSTRDDRNGCNSILVTNEKKNNTMLTQPSNIFFLAIFQSIPGLRKTQLSHLHHQVHASCTNCSNSLKPITCDPNLKIKKKTW